MSVALATKVRSGMRGGQGAGRVDVGRLVWLDVIRTMGKDSFDYLTIPRCPDFGPFLLPFSVKKAMKEIKVRKRYDAAGFFTSRRRGSTNNAGARHLPVAPERGAAPGDPRHGSIAGQADVSRKGKRAGRREALLGALVELLVGPGPRHTGRASFLSARDGGL